MVPQIGTLHICCLRPEWADLVLSGGMVCMSREVMCGVRPSLPTLHVRRVPGYGTRVIDYAVGTPVSRGRHGCP